VTSAIETPTGHPVSTGPGGAALSFERASKVFADGTEAVRDVSFELDPGELVSVVGPSGCGKSTLLKLASGLLTLSSGEIRASEPNMGYVFQDPTLLPWRSVRKNVELFAELHGVDKARRAELATWALDLVSLSDFSEHLPGALSGGMKMRASLARSLSLQPPLFLFDEPFGALDEITRQMLNDELQRLFTDQRFGAIFITHSVSEAVYLATRVLVMSDRPGEITATYEVPFAYPREPDLRYSPEFAELAGNVSQALRGHHG